MKKEKFRMFIARFLDKVFPYQFCWSELAMWALGYGKFKERSYNAKNCRKYCEDNYNGCCYCGKFKDGKLNKMKTFEVYEEELPF